MLDGAHALAVPTVYGQTLLIHETDTPGELQWVSVDDQGQPWLEATFSTDNLHLLSSMGDKAEKLQQLLQAARRLNPSFLKHPDIGWNVEAKLDFPLNWGLGSSSTLISMVARWAKVNAFELLRHSFGGSGYDVACAISNGPILYQLNNGQPQWEPTAFVPPYAHNLFFVHLGRKQDSREGIERYRAKGTPDILLLNKITALTDQLRLAADLAIFEGLLEVHEQLVSDHLDLPRVKDERFPDYWGAVKSLGAWGGDFVLATSQRDSTETQAYFHSQGLETVIPYNEMVITPEKEDLD